MISIIIPASNEENYLKDTIKSIKSQDFKHYEIIVVCDGCTDNTEKIAKKLANKVILIPPPRKGSGNAKDKGAKEAKYNKLVFLDADTHPTKGTLKAISTTLNKKNTYGTCKIKPSNTKPKHRLMMYIKNLYPFPFSNGIIFCTKKEFKKTKGFGKVHKGEDGSLVKQLDKNNKFTLINKYVISSSRRFENRGYLKVGLYWIKECIKPSKNKYSIIR